MLAKKIPEGYEVRREWSLTKEGWRQKSMTVPIYDEEAMKRDVLMQYIMYCALTPLKPLKRT